eukprot:Seg1763.6 transcript_id=Seg1763.6/GoldUCD/mRNA.D3Y31 product="hypothetical protein" protein_id=Seg1763.6/GoldUCD/D3Y31
MYLGNMLMLLAVLLYTLKQGDCAAAPDNDDEKGMGKGFDVDEMAEIGKVLTTAEFKDLIKWIEDAKVCIRNGVKAENACYQLDDFQKGKAGDIDMEEMMKVMKWVHNPASDPTYSILWYQRLFNAIYFSVLANKDEEKTTFLLAEYTSPGNERYPVGKGIGDKETASKAQVDRQYGKSIDIDIQDALKDMPKNVRHLLEWMHGILKEIKTIR